MASFCFDLVLHRRVFQMSIILGLGGTFLFGFQVSMINSTSPYIKKFINNTWLERYNIPIDDQSLTLLWSFIVSTFSFGGLIGTCISRTLTAKYGRKNCLIFCSLSTLVAAVIMGTSKMARSFEMILLGRLLYGFNAGLGCCIQGPAGVTFPVMVELFTQTSRPAAIVLSMSLHWTGLYLIGIFFPYVVHHLGTFSFLVFAGVIAISWVLIFRFLPETKGKSFVDIQREFKHVKMGKKKDAEIGMNLPEISTMCTKL